MSAVDVVGLLQFTAAVLKKCYDYGCAVNAAPDEARSLTDSVTSLYAILVDLEALKSLAPPTINHQYVSIDSFSEDLAVCRLELGALDAWLCNVSPADGEKFRRHLNRAAFPFRVKDLRERQQSIEAKKSRIHEHVQRATAKMVSHQTARLKHLQSIADNATLVEFLGRLSAYNYTHSHNRLIERRALGTYQWLFDQADYMNWDASTQPLLWMHGPSGAGKSVIAATLVERLLDDAYKTDSLVIRYYFNSSDESTTTKEALISAIARQVCERSHMLPIKVIQQLLPTTFRASHPDIAELTSALPTPIDLAASKLDILVDAVNEASNPEQVTHWLLGLISQSKSKIRLFISSTTDTGTNDYSTSTFKQLSLGSSEMQLADIDVYVQKRLQENKEVQKHGVQGQDRLAKSITLKSRRMFRYAKCVLDELEHYRAEEMEANISTLPNSDDPDDNLIQLYNRSVEKLFHGSRQVLEGTTAAMMTFLILGPYPMTPDELSASIQMARALQNPTHTALSGERLQKPTNEILQRIMQRLGIFAEYDSDFIRVSHDSVRAFFLENKCSRSSLHLGDRSKSDRFKLVCWMYLEHALMDPLMNNLASSTRLRLIREKYPLVRHTARVCYLALKDHDPSIASMFLRFIQDFQSNHRDLLVRSLVICYRREVGEAFFHQYKLRARDNGRVGNVVDAYYFTHATTAYRIRYFLARSEAIYDERLVLALIFIPSLLVYASMLTLGMNLYFSGFGAGFTGLLALVNVTEWWTTSTVIHVGPKPPGK